MLFKELVLFTHSADALFCRFIDTVAYDTRSRFMVICLPFQDNDYTPNPLSIFP